MDGLLHDPVRHSQLELLVSQQRYEESVSLLNSAIEADPTDRDAYLYRLLVARIIVLRRAADARQASRAGWVVRGRAQSLELFHRALMPGSAAARRWRQSGRGQGTLRDLYAGLRVETRTSWNWISNAAARYWKMNGPKLRRLVRVVNLRRLAWGMRAVVLAAAISIISIITALCVIFLSRSSARGPAPQEASQPAAAFREFATRQGPPIEDEERNAPVTDMRVASAANLNVTGQITGEENSDRTGLVESKRTRAQRESPDSQPAKVSGAVKTSSVRNAARDDAEPIPLNGKRRAEKEVQRRDARPQITARYTARHLITVREAPRYGASTLETFSAGASIPVLDVSGSWAKILLADDKTGFVRVEFLDPSTLPEPKP